MSGYGRSRISVEVEEKLHSFWQGRHRHRSIYFSRHGTV
jgi:ribosomal protein L31